MEYGITKIVGPFWILAPPPKKNRKNVNVSVNAFEFHEKLNKMRPVPTKWETSRKISFPSYNQIHVVQALSFKMICYMSGLLPIWGPKTHYFLEKFLCFLLIFEMFNELCLLSSCRSFRENRSQMLSVLSKMKALAIHYYKLIQKSCVIFSTK